MIKLFSLKQEKEAEAAQSAAGEQKKVAPGLLRMQKGGVQCWLRPRPMLLPPS